MIELLNPLDEKDILKVFTKNNVNCEAYQDFLSQRGITQLNSVEDIPITDKDNYFRKYSLMQKLHKGMQLSDYYMICSSSGSTGEPTFWPRDMQRDELAEKGHTAFLDEHFDVLSKKSLIVVALDLGSTTAGLMHTRLSWDLSKKANATVITPGCRPSQTADMIENLYLYYDQVVLLAYPTLINEILDYAIEKNFSFQKWNLKFGYTGSGANEIWRLELINKYHLLPSSIISFYGCTETGFIGVESKAVNNLINVCLENPFLIKKIFKTDYLPTIVDEITPNKYFEIIDGELIITVDQPIPLIRFNLHDEASIVSVKQINRILDKENIRADLSNFKNQNWLIIHGRKHNTHFSIEEVQKAIDLSNTRALLKEFQYQESFDNDLLIISFVLYQKNKIRLSQKEIGQIHSQLTKIFQAKYKCQIRLTIKKEAERIGYKSGKLSYFF